MSVSCLSEVSFPNQYSCMALFNKIGLTWHNQISYVHHVIIVNQNAVFMGMNKITLCLSTIEEANNYLAKHNVAIEVW